METRHVRDMEVVTGLIGEAAMMQGLKHMVAACSTSAFIACKEKPAS